MSKKPVGETDEAEPYSKFVAESVSNPRWANEEKTVIEVMVQWKGWPKPVPFGAAPWDVEAHGREMFEAAKKGAYGAIKPYKAPPEPPESRFMAPVDFLDRFKDKEADKLVEAAMKDVKVKRFYDRILASQEINLDDDKIIAGIEALVPDILTSARADKILGKG